MRPQVLILSELSDLWAEYSDLEHTGDTTKPRGKAIEQRIHELQKAMGTSIYDFDKRRQRNETNAQPSVSGPPDMNSPSPSDEKKVPHNSCFVTFRGQPGDGTDPGPASILERWQVQAVNHRLRDESYHARIVRFRSAAGTYCHVC